MKQPYISFDIIGKPVGKERARSTMNGRHYTPKATREYEKHVAMSAKKALLALSEEEQKAWPTDKQVYMDLWIKHESGKKPDADNIVKAIQDGMTGVLWPNDNNVLPRVWAVMWPSDKPMVSVRVYKTSAGSLYNGI